jgi:hypothetical protein
MSPVTAGAAPTVGHAGAPDAIAVLIMAFLGALMWVGFK